MTTPTAARKNTEVFFFTGLDRSRDFVKERNHWLIDWFIDKLLFVCMHVQLYEQWFEEKLLLETGDFYRQEARKLLDEYNCSEYMERVCYLCAMLSVV